MNNNKRSLPSKQAEQSLESARGSCDVLKAAELHIESEQNIEVPRYARQSLLSRQYSQQLAQSMLRRGQSVGPNFLLVNLSPSLSHMSLMSR